MPVFSLRQPTRSSVEAPMIPALMQRIAELDSQEVKLVKPILAPKPLNWRQIVAPNKAPTAAVSAIAKAPQNVTLTALFIKGAPPT